MARGSLGCPIHTSRRRNGSGKPKRTRLSRRYWVYVLTRTHLPETKLGAVKTLKPIQDLEHQVAIKDQQISQKDEEIRQLKSQVETKKYRARSCWQRMGSGVGTE